MCNYLHIKSKWINTNGKWEVLNNNDNDILLCNFPVDFSFFYYTYLYSYVKHSNKIDAFRSLFPVIFTSSVLVNVCLRIE